jgi:hypothetical protein
MAITEDSYCYNTEERNKQPKPKVVRIISSAVGIQRRPANAYSARVVSCF